MLKNGFEVAQFCLRSGLLGFFAGPASPAAAQGAIDVFVNGVVVFAQLLVVLLELLGSCRYPWTCGSCRCPWINGLERRQLVHGFSAQIRHGNCSACWRSCFPSWRSGSRALSPCRTGAPAGCRSAGRGYLGHRPRPHRHIPIRCHLGHMVANDTVLMRIQPGHSDLLNLSWRRLGKFLPNLGFDLRPKWLVIDRLSQRMKTATRSLGVPVSLDNLALILIFRMPELLLMNTLLSLGLPHLQRRPHALSFVAQFTILLSGKLPLVKSIVYGRKGRIEPLEPHLLRLGQLPFVDCKRAPDMLLGLPGVPWRDFPGSGELSSLLAHLLPLQLQSIAFGLRMPGPLLGA